MKIHLIGILVFFLAFLTSHLLVPVPIGKNQSDIVYQAEPEVPAVEEAFTMQLKSLEEIDDDFEVSDKFSIQLLETGPNFHADQIKAKNGEKWLGLFSERGVYSIRESTLKIKRVPDEDVHGASSDRKGELTGKSVTVIGGVQPLFLLKNAPSIREGPVVTIFEGMREDWRNESAKPTYLDKNFRRSFELAGKIYELKVIKAKNKRGDPILALMLESDGVRQLLHTFWTRTEGEYGEKNWLGSVGTLYWIGDLDRDKKPDFYLSLYTHMIIYNSFLYLSSEAKNGKLVDSAAVFETSGCG